LEFEVDGSKLLGVPDDELLLRGAREHVDGVSLESHEVLGLESSELPAKVRHLGIGSSEVAGGRGHGSVLEVGRLVPRFDGFIVLIGQSHARA
jgi:hypothetical protein